MGLPFVNLQAILRLGLKVALITWKFSSLQLLVAEAEANVSFL